MTPNEKIKRYAYQRYQYHWLEEHDCSLEDIASHIVVYCSETDISTASSKEALETLCIHGQCYACFDEFLTCEYLDKDYIRSILPAHKYAEYLEDVDSLFKIFRTGQREEFYEYYRYWSNEFYAFYDSNGNEIDEEQLPAELFRAHHLLRKPIITAGKTHLAQIPSGFGVTATWLFSGSRNFHYISGIAATLKAQFTSIVPGMEVAVVDRDVHCKSCHAIEVFFPAMMDPSDFHDCYAQMGKLITSQSKEYV